MRITFTRVQEIVQAHGFYIEREGSNYRYGNNTGIEGEASTLLEAYSDVMDMIRQYEQANPPEGEIASENAGIEALGDREPKGIIA
jgi:hypothetical protein